MMAHNLCYTTLLAPGTAASVPPEQYERSPSGDCFVKARSNLHCVCFSFRVLALKPCIVCVASGASLQQTWWRRPCQDDAHCNTRLHLRRAAIAAQWYLWPLLALPQLSSAMGMAHVLLHATPVCCGAWHVLTRLPAARCCVLASRAHRLPAPPQAGVQRGILPEILEELLAARKRCAPACLPACLCPVHSLALALCCCVG